MELKNLKTIYFLTFYFVFILVTSQRKAPKQTKKNPTPNGEVQLKGDINASTMTILEIIYL